MSNVGYIILLLVCLPLTIFSQTGPGGVGSNDGTSNLEFWYMAQGENYSDGNLIDTIFDRSGNGRTITAATIERPTYTATTAAANNMSSMLFDGNDELETSYNGNSNENMSFGTIFSYTADANLDIIIQHGGRNTIGVNSADLYTDFVGNSNHTSGTSATATWTYHSKTFANAGANRLNYYEDLTNTDVFNHNIENRTSNTFIGGNGPGGGTGLNGSIAEVYKFSRVLNSAEQIIIANYLSAKYGTSLNQNNVYTRDNPGAGDYDFDVAGIGRIDASNLHDDAQGTGVVRILNPTNLGNNEFLMWGHDNGVMAATNVADVPGTVQARFERVWRVSERNSTNTGNVNVGNIDMRWDLSNMGAITTSDLRLLIDTDNDGLFSDETPIGGATSLGGNIYEFANVSGGATGIRNNRRFTLGTINSSATPLPIDLISFEALLNNKQVDLKWVTATEINNDFFTIERSVDAKKWEEVLYSSGAGNSNQIIEYFDVDYMPITGVSYYRLKQTDYDGAFTYSNIVPVKLEENNLSGTINVFPNPVNAGEKVQIEFNNIPTSEILVVLRDIEGKEFYSKIIINSEDGELVGVPINKNLPTGIYLITATSNNKIYSKKLIIK